MGDGSWRTGAVAALATGMFTAGCVSGCVFGVVTSGDSGDEIPRSEPVTMTTRATEPRAAFSNTVASLPISFEDARLLAISSCRAFEQNPGTDISSAIKQLAAQQGWTSRQASQFLGAATESYCPEFRRGS